MQETPPGRIPLMGPTLDDAIRRGLDLARAAEEKTLRAHLAGHPIEEWAAAVVALDALVRANQRAGEVVATTERWKVQLPAGTLKGITEADARRIAGEHHGAVYRSTITLYVDGGEYLSPWEPA